jgi:hypothetical protein
MIETIKREGDIIMVHTSNRKIPIVEAWTNCWLTSKKESLHDCHFLLRQDSETFSFDYGDITDLIETLVHVKLTLQREFEGEETSE